jgi:hypothetical protein
MTGDKYQYLLVLYEALLTMRLGSGVVGVEFEIPDAGNVDDLVIIGPGGPVEYHQVKFVLEPTGDPLTAAWFTQKKSEKATSPLQKFHASFINLGRPCMWLQTNRDADPEDPILGRRNGRNLNLGERLRAANARPVREAIEVWCEHLELTRDELLDFLDHLHVQTGEPAYERLVVACGDRMRGEGLRGEPEMVKAALAMVEDLVIDNKQRVGREELNRIIDKLGLRADDARATLLVQQVVEDPWPDAATAAVDWTRFFEDDAPEARRRLRADLDWNEHLLPPLREGADAIRGSGHARVLITGSPRLSGWFAAGFTLRQVTGLEVTARSGPTSWSSHETQIAMPVERMEPAQLGNGEEIAIAISVPRLIGDAVRQYLEPSSGAIAELVELRAKGAPDNVLIQDAEQARGLTTAFFLEIEKVAAGRPIHLFFAAPGPLLGLLGHRWNRMPPLQLYEDTGGDGADGYRPTFAFDKT